MKSLTFVSIAVAALFSPVLCFAQTASPLTRAEVRADLIRLEQAGYNPASGDDLYYPANIQDAEAKVAAEQARQTGNDAAVGTAGTGTSAAGKRATAPRDSSSSCVGPASFCDIYYGE
ncbi:DUF4148 domain-containing protein [Paraburkholderia solisilvae]|uniref:DUF4148 domain-containing protein n=1 Tax=Paraburkholderia solisilvae TaxID=624376 RepID=A0A6J5F1M2_9BURK|nr:DUF4148 domain-containing protein [Paraburkholderia solisilvae]CAB3771166.1 hypothetical protein LMG29739_05973 [Paraburkholderia solisilvae]